MSGFAAGEQRAVRLVQLGGGRELVSAERAKQLVAEITEKNPTDIRLSNKSFDNGAAAVIAEYISSLGDSEGGGSALQVADISDIIAGRPEEEALRTLSIISSSLKKFPLIELNVSDNAMGAKGIEACRDVLCNNKLQRLYVCNDGLSAEACVLLAQILRADNNTSSTTATTATAATAATTTAEAAIATTPPLTLLHCYNNMAGDGGAAAFAAIVVACPLLEDFRFSATRSTKIGCHSIATAIGGLSNLRRLDLSDNNFSGKTGAALAASLVGKERLEYVNLRDDAMGADVTCAVAAAIAANTATTTSSIATATAASVVITHLDLSGNDLDSDSAQLLLPSLQRMKNIVYLALDDCELGSDGAKFIATAVADMLQLKTLSCCCCEITASGAYFLAKAVIKLPQFVTLELNGNQLSETAVAAVQSLLSEAGKVLGDLEDNDEDGEDDLEEALAHFEQTETTAATAADDAATDDLAAALAAAKL